MAMYIHQNCVYVCIDNFVRIFLQILQICSQGLTDMSCPPLTPMQHSFIFYVKYHSIGTLFGITQLLNLEICTS